MRDLRTELTNSFATIDWAAIEPRTPAPSTPVPPTLNPVKTESALSFPPARNQADADAALDAYLAKWDKDFAAAEAQAAIPANSYDASTPVEFSDGPLESFTWDELEPAVTEQNTQVKPAVYVPKPLRKFNALRKTFAQERPSRFNLPTRALKAAALAATMIGYVAPVSAGSSDASHLPPPTKTVEQLATEQIQQGTCKTWPAPIQEPYVTSWYGKRHMGNIKGSTFHRSLDIRAPAKSTVVAACPGIVQRAEGDVVEIANGGIVSTYRDIVPNTKLSIGDIVYEGDRIGNVAQSAQPHVHFEIMFDSTRVNGICAFSEKLRDEVIANYEKKIDEKKIDEKKGKLYRMKQMLKHIPTAFRHLKGDTVREMADNSCESTIATMKNFYQRRLSEN